MSFAGDKGRGMGDSGAGSRWLGLAAGIALMGEVDLAALVTRAWQAGKRVMLRSYCIGQ